MNIPRSKQLKRFLVFGVAVSLMIGLLDWRASRADESSEPITGLYIEDAVATPADAGETAIIGFRIDNFSHRNVSLIGVSSQNADLVMIILRGGGVGPDVATAVAVMQEETLDLRTSHMWVELRGLKSEIREGDFVPFDLVFARGRVSVRAHAHARAQAGAMPGGR